MREEKRSVRKGPALVPAKRPKAVERIAYFASAVVLALGVGLVARVQAWDRGTAALAMVIAAVLFVAVATPLLLGRRART